MVRVDSGIVVFVQAEDGIRDLVRSRGLGDVYKRQAFSCCLKSPTLAFGFGRGEHLAQLLARRLGQACGCLLYTSDAADERSSVDLGGRRII